MRIIQANNNTAFTLIKAVGLGRVRETLRARSVTYSRTFLLRPITPCPLRSHGVSYDDLHDHGHHDVFYDAHDRRGHHAYGFSYDA